MRYDSVALFVYVSTHLCYWVIWCNFTFEPVPRCRVVVPAQEWINLLNKTQISPFINIDKPGAINIIKYNKWFIKNQYSQDTSSGEPFSPLIDRVLKGCHWGPPMTSLLWQPCVSTAVLTSFYMYTINSIYRALHPGTAAALQMMLKQLKVSLAHGSQQSRTSILNAVSGKLN